MGNCQKNDCLCFELCLKKTVHLVPEFANRSVWMPCLSWMLIDQVWLTKIWGQGKTYQQIDKSGILISKSSISGNKFYSIVSECKEFLSFKLKQLLTISVNPKLVNICFIKIILSKIILYTCNRLYKLVMWTFFPHIFNHYLLKLRI